MNPIIKWLAVCGVAITLAACSSTKGGSQSGSSSVNSPTPVYTPPPKVEAPKVAEINPLDDPNNLLSKRVIYFGFDQYTVTDEYRAILEAHSAYIASNPNVSVVLEGHCDERGTREYNLALGERRGNAAKQLLSLGGAQDSQLEIVSYGEEQPVAIGHNDEAWALNRRVEIKYQR